MADLEVTPSSLARYRVLSLLCPLHLLRHVGSRGWAGGGGPLWTPDVYGQQAVDTIHKDLRGDADIN